MQTPAKEKENLQANIAKATLVKAAAEMIFNLQSGTIVIPGKYKDQVLATKELLKNDISGIVNSLIDFSITCGLVDFTVETDNENLTELFNTWLYDINNELRGQIPTGLKALQKEYLRERWKGSSFLLLRSIWEERDGFIVPTKLWFVNGEDIVIDDKSDASVIGSEKYLLQLDKRTQRSLPASKNEKIFIQKPYESWGTSYPTPFIIRRGIYKNLKMLEALATKGEYVITKALEYLLLLKKGTENLALANQSDFTYSSEELKQIKEKLEEILGDRKNIAGTPTYAANFDTELQHLIPEYDKALKQELYSPMERRLLAGLGLIDVLQGVSSTRRESTLNPRPFITEVESGISDFKMILEDILETIVQLNRVAHPKYIGSIRKIHNTPISQFITDDIRTQFRSMYDRGVISKQTYVEVVGEGDIVVEYNRRKTETAEVKKVFYPPVVQNMEATVNEGEEIKDAPPSKKVSEDKKGVEKKNFKSTIESAIYLELPKSAQKIWDKVCSDNSSEGLEKAEKISLAVIKKLYTKKGDKWIAKKKAKLSSGMIDLENANLDEIIAEVSKLKELEIKENQLRLLKKLNEGEA